jgi:hypothetical protein
VLEGLRKRLQVFHDHTGRELFDLPDAPRPDAAIPAPPRFLPDYDNVLLGHADRTRIVGHEHQGAGFIGVSTFLVDGFVGGAWKIQRARRRALLEITPYRRLSKRDQQAVEAEATRLLDFVAAEAGTRDIRFHRTA